MAWTIRLRVRLALVLVACVPTSEGLAYRQVPVVIRGQQGHSFCRPGHSCRATVRAFASEPNEERDGGGSVALDLDIDGNLSSWQRFIASLPSAKGDEMDRRILSTAIPSMVNLLVVPLVNAVDTFYVGNLGSAEALAAQSSANQIFFSIYFLAAFLPTITAPLVADAIGKEDWKSAKQRVCESLFLGNILGGLFSLALLLYPARVLRLVVPPSTDSAVMALAVPYLRCRALGMIPTLVASTGFAAYRGLLNTVTPLKVTIVTNLLNLVLDPILIGGSLLRSVFGGFGAAGAAIATSASEFTSSLIYLRLLFRRKLVDWTKLIKPPSLASLLPLVQGGFAMLIRQMTLNVAFVSAARRAQAMDSSGTMAAAYAIVMQIYSLGVVLHLGIQGTAAALVPSARAMGGAQGDEAARKIADRIFSWGTLLGVILALVQMVAIPYIAPLFSPLESVRQAVKGPAVISALIHLVNGLVFAGEGVMLGLGQFKDLALITCCGVGTMVACLKSPLGQTLNGVLLSLAAFNTVQGLLTWLHHIRFSPLRRRGFRKFRKGLKSVEDEC